MLRFVFVLFLLLSGCSEKELLNGLTQEDANQISIALGEYGISSQVESGNKSSFLLIVNSRELHEARILLNKLGLPKEKQQSFEELIKPSGFIPNSRKMEQLRHDHILARELEDVIKLISDVEKVKAIVRINSLEEGLNPSVSVLVQGSNLSDKVKDKIITLTKKTFPNLNNEMIDVVIENKKPFSVSENSNGKINNKGEILTYPLVPFFIWKVPVGVNNEIVIAVVLLTGFAFLLGILFGWFISKYRYIVKRDTSDD